MTSLFLFMLIFNILFGLFAHAFTVFPSFDQEIYRYDISIDEVRLNSYGISFVNATSFNVTWKEAPQIFEQNDKKFRVKWDEIGILGLRDGWLFEKQSIIEQWADTWYFPEKQMVGVGETGEPMIEVWNSSIVSYFSTEFNWTKIDIASGVTAFITTINSDSNNITKAVYETGTLTLTVGEPREESYTVGNFIDWYWGIVFGFNDYGLPSSMAWIMRIIFTLTVGSFVFMTRSLTRL